MCHEVSHELGTRVIRFNRHRMHLLVHGQSIQDTYGTLTAFGNLLI